MRDHEYQELQNRLMLLGNLLPEVDELNEMCSRISHAEAAQVLAYRSPIPASNIEPGYRRIRALAEYARRLAKARAAFEELRGVVLDTEVLIHREKGVR